MSSRSPRRAASEIAVQAAPRPCRNSYGAEERGMGDPTGTIPPAIGRIRHELGLPPSGRPILVASDNAATQCFVQVHNIGLASRLGDDRAANVGGLVRIIASLMADDAARQRRAESTRRLAKSLAATATGGMIDIVRASLK